MDGVLALLGPDGAGKTTLVRILTTLLRADDGWARVAGFDVRRDAAALRSVIGLSGQAVGVRQSGYEALMVTLCSVGVCVASVVASVARYWM